MTIATVRQAMATALSGVTGLRGNAYVPDQVTAGSAIVSRGIVNYDITFSDPSRDKSTYTFTVTVFQNRTAERSSQAAMDVMCDVTGAGSVKAALESAATIAAAGADYIVVNTASEVKNVTVGTVDYLSVEFEVEVVF